MIYALLGYLHAAVTRRVQQIHRLAAGEAGRTRCRSGSSPAVARSGFAEELTLRYADGISSIEGDARAALEAQAPKRVAIQFKPLRTFSWDHRKLGGSY